MELRNRIHYRGKRINIKVDESPKDERQLLGFLFENDAPKCFVKTGNHWYKLTREGTLLKVVRTLYLFSFRDFYNVAMNDNFTANN